MNGMGYGFTKNAEKWLKLLLVGTSFTPEANTPDRARKSGTVFLKENFRRVKIKSADGGNTRVLLVFREGTFSLVGGVGGSS